MPKRQSEIMANFSDGKPVSQASLITAATLKTELFSIASLAKSKSVFKLLLFLTSELPV